MKILIATSDPNYINTLRESLSKKNDITLIETGKEIFNLLSENEYDCLITEAELEDIDVIILSKYIKNNIAQPLPIFVIKDDNKNTNQNLLKINYDIDEIDLLKKIDIALLVKNKSTFRPSILIIEDDFHISNPIKISLSEHYCVDVCVDIKEGIEKWKIKKHNLIILDLMLPSGSGEEVLTEVRAIFPKQLVIIVSAKSEIDIQEKLILSGANNYLTKPFTLNELKKACRISLTQDIFNNCTNDKNKETYVNEKSDDFLLEKMMKEKN